MYFLVLVATAHHSHFVNDQIFQLTHNFIGMLELVAKCWCWKYILVGDGFGGPIGFLVFSQISYAVL